MHSPYLPRRAMEVRICLGPALEVYILTTQGLLLRKKTATHYSSAMTPLSDNTNTSTTMNPPPDRPQRTYAPETLLNQKKSRNIIASGTLQRQPCTNCERMKLDCFLDRSISNLCQYCVERKKVCSINPQGRRGITARKKAKRADEVQKEAAKDESKTSSLSAM